MPPLPYSPKVGKNRKNRKGYKHGQSQKRWEENSGVKALRNTQKLLKEEDDLDIERAKLVVAKILQAKALHNRWKKEDASSTLKDKKLVQHQKL